ncbi:hypothetical protein RhiirA4_541656 [Rhizophagus irregularis]|uniref:RING-type domain-containing protein n=1 Tax=Rhizophagus irregularis TaxID=588596 RepID=A0A2I1GC26_9GLOM|nr:hypothetical protein RhiirA4_541656 [Rhizophagus irregularis]
MQCVIAVEVKVPICRAQNPESFQVPERSRPSLANHRNLAYNILKYLEIDIVGDKEILELEPCSECTNNILALSLKALTILSCGHIFHRSCIEKQLLFIKPSACPFPDCGKTVEIVVNPNSTRRDSQSSQSSGISALTNLMGEKFNLPIFFYESENFVCLNEYTKGYLIPKVVSDEIRGRSSTSDDSTKKSRKIFSSKSFKVKIFWINCSTVMKTLKRASESDDLSEAEDDGIEDAIIDAGARNGIIATIGDDEGQTSEQQMYPLEQSAEDNYELTR